MSTEPRPRKAITVTARHSVRAELEHYRSRDIYASKETVLARFGVHLASLGWEAKDVMITNVHIEVEDATTQQIRNRMIRPRA